MKAIVSVMQESSGERVYLLGMGETEREARIAAYATVNHGHNMYDDEYACGVLCNVSQELVALYKGADDSLTSYDETTGAITIEAPDEELAFERALGRLYLDGSTLKFRA